MKALFGQAAFFQTEIRSKPVVLLTPETGVPVLDLKTNLSIFQNLKKSSGWSISVRSSLSQWNAKDGEAVTTALLKTSENPVKKILSQKKPRPVRAKMSIRLSSKETLPEVVSTSRGAVTIPTGNGLGSSGTETVSSKEKSEHTEIQYLLLRLGVSMGMSVYVASNDVNRKYKGKKLSEYFDLQKSLPQQFDVVTNKTIGYIDVLWFKGGTYYAAFEVESTTSIYSGLLRMSDLLARQQNLKIPLYIVAPDGRREKVKEEINRPTFERFETPMVKVCRFISFSALRTKFRQMEEAGILSAIKPSEFLKLISEDCIL